MATKKKKQPELPAIKGPGVEAVEITEIDDCVHEYVNVRDKRMELTKKEVLAREALKMVMHRHEDRLAKEDGALLYRCDDLIVRCRQGEEKVSVKSAVEDEELD